MTSADPFPVPDWLVTMPKVELHVHLEGTIAPATMWQLMQHHGVSSGISSEQDVERSLYSYSDFAHFIDTFTRCSDYLRSADDIGMVTEAYGTEMARQNIRYAELHFNPESNFRRRGVGMAESLDAMNAARERLRLEYGIEMRWIPDGIRDAAPGPVSAERTVDFMIEVGHDAGIVALGLGGNEIGNPPYLFQGAFAKARSAGFHVVAHAGEALGPESINDTLDCLHPERIGHGIAAARDPELMADLASRGIPLEISPTSNLRTGVIASLDELPLRTFVDAGVPFSINSDDPPMFGTTLTREYAIAAHLLGLDRRGVAQMVNAAIEQSFADDVTKRRLHRELRAHTPLD